MVYLGQLALVLLGPGRGVFPGPVLLGLLLLPQLGLLLLRLLGPAGPRCGGGRGLCSGGGVLPLPLEVEGDEPPHEEALQQPDGHQRAQAERERVEVSGGGVHHLPLGRGQRQAVPEGEDGQQDGAESGQHEERVIESEERGGEVWLVGVSQEASRVEDGLHHVVQEQQAEPDSGVGEGVGAHNEGQVQRGGADLLGHVLALNL